MFVIAPMISHSLATNMAFGTKNEEFLVEECPEIFRFLYPVSEKKEDNYIFGIHTGAYGAVKLAMKHQMCMQDVLLSMANLILQEDARIVKTGRQDSDISQRNH